MTSSEVGRREYTIAEYARLRESGSVRSELVRGRLVREPRPGFEHGRIQAKLAARLQERAERDRLGVVVTDVGIVLADDPPTVRGPDIAFISFERLPDPPPEGFLEVAPDLAVEIVSPGNSASEIQEKVVEYLDAGTRLVWVVDPGARTVTVYRSLRDIRVLTAADDLTGEDVLPGFGCRAGTFFRPAP